MSLTEFRTYRNDCCAFQSLTNLTDNQIVTQLQSHMDSDRKRIIDANHPTWNTSTLEEALDIVKDIVYETRNPSVYRKQFDNIV